MATSTTHSGFTFQAKELANQLSLVCEEMLTGYWQITIELEPQSRIWYLSIVQGRVVFSGERLSWGAFVAVMQRYFPRLRSPKVKAALELLERQAASHERARLTNQIVHLEKLRILTHEETLQAIRQAILHDLNTYLFTPYSGQAQFITDFELIAQAPILGFSLGELLAEVAQQQEQWKKIKPLIPTLEAIPILIPEALDKSNLSSQQRSQLVQVTDKGYSMAKIAEELGRDTLDIAKTFALFVKNGLVRLQLPPGSVPPPKAEIFIVDDSPLLLKRFQSLVEPWGYHVSVCSQPLKAIDEMLTVKPALVFLDINMPEVTGFELIKQIRRQPDLARIQIVLLTAEKSVSNQFRAQWANCKFLAKPRQVADMPAFQAELRMILEEMVP
jgi:CheY-like chemotaxis protein